jgi:hypothetical protein
MGQARRRKPREILVRGKVGQRPWVEGIKRGKRESDAAPTTPPTQGQARMIRIDHAIVVEFEMLLLPRNPNPLAKPRRRAVVKLSLSPVPHLLLQQVPPRARRASRLASNCLSRCEAEENQRGPRTGSARQQFDFALSLQENKSRCRCKRLVDRQLSGIPAPRETASGPDADGFVLASLHTFQNRKGGKLPTLLHSPPHDDRD